MPNPKIVFIDLDNTLYEYKSAHSAGQSALNEFIAMQLGMDSRQVEIGLDLARQDVKARLGDMASGHSRLLYVTQFLINHKVVIRPSFAIAAEQSYWRTYLLNIEILEGVKDLLTALRLRSCRIVLVSDLTTSIQYRKLVWMGLESYFDLILTSEDAGGDKVTGKLETVLESIIGEIPSDSWCIGDQEWDHLFKDRTTFYLRSDTRKVQQLGPQIYSFRKFSDLQKLLD